MKILVGATEYYPHGSGIANVAYHIVQQLQKKGIECVVCSPTGPDIILGNPALIQRFGIVGLCNYWNQVSTYFRKNDFDLAWLHNPFFLRFNPFPASLVTMNSTYYGEGLHRVGNSEFQILYKKMVARIEQYCLKKNHKNSLFTGVGQKVCDELVEIGIQKDNVYFVPNGIDCDLFHPADNKVALRKKFGIPEEDVILLSVGRLENAKQPEKVIELFSLLQNEDTHLSLCMAGKGELKRKILDFASRKQVKNLFMLDHVRHEEDLPDLYACCDYFVIASKYEGGSPPLTVLEAMSAGLPVIASDILNFQVVNEANCGILVDFGDLEVAAQQVTRYLRNDSGTQGMNGRTHAMKHFDWKIIADKYLSLFDILLQKA
jgi:1,2-diacylglycerol 3-alpha-glucosyltransferase